MFVPADEMVPRPDSGRVFSLGRWPGLGDCAPSGRMRLDAIARCLQDVAYADVEDAGLADAAVWVVRRCRIAVHRWPRFAERLTVETFCSGLGRMWAERRTALLGEDGETLVDAVALWVHLSPETWMPSPLTDGEMEIYGGNIYNERRIRSRLHHPKPDGTLRQSDWIFRATDLDVADHINNAAYWQPLEERLLTDGLEPETLQAELEFRTPAQPGAVRILADGDARLWIAGADGTLYASLVLSTA